MKLKSSITGTTNRPSFGVYIPLGKPTEKHKPVKQMTNTPMSDSQSLVEQEKSLPVNKKETGNKTEIVKGKFDESVLKEPEKKVISGDTTDTEPKTSLFGKNKRRISHYSAKDSKSVKRSNDNQRKLASPLPDESPAKKMKRNDENQRQLADPILKESPAKRTKLSHENKSKLLSTFRKDSPTNRSKHPFKTFPINRLSNISPAKQVKDIDIQKKSARSNDYSDKTSNTETTVSDGRPVLFAVDNIFEKLNEKNTLEIDGDNKINAVQSKPVLKRTHDDIANDTFDKRRKHDEAISETAKKCSILVCDMEASEWNMTNIVKDDKKYDGKAKVKTLNKNKPYSNSGKRKGYSPDRICASTPKASKCAERVPDEIQHSLSDSNAEKLKMDMNNYTDNCYDSGILKMTKEKDVKQDKIESKLLNLESLNEVSNVEETSHTSKFGMQEHTSQNNSKAENSIEVDHTLNISGLESEKQIEPNINVDNKALNSETVITAKVKRLFKDTHRKNICEESSPDKDKNKTEFNQIQCYENNSETRTAKVGLSNSPLRETAQKSEEKDGKCTLQEKKHELDKNMPNIVDEDCGKGDNIFKVFGHIAEQNIEVEKEVSLKDNENNSSTCIDEIKDAENIDNRLKADKNIPDVVNDRTENLELFYEKEDNKIDKRKSSNSCTHTNSDMNDNEPTDKKGSVSVTNTSTKENDTSIVSDPQVDAECINCCQRIKFIDDFVVSHNCVKHDPEKSIDNCNENPFDGEKCKSVKKEIHSKNRCVVEEKLICDLIAGIRTKHEVDQNEICEGEAINSIHVTNSSNENACRLPVRPMKKTPRKKFASQLDTLGKTIEEENTNQYTELSSKKEEFRKKQILTLRKQPNNEKELDDDDLILSVVELTPSKQSHVSHTDSTEWLKKAKSNLKVPANLKAHKALEKDFEEVNKCNSTISKDTETFVTSGVQMYEKNQDTQKPATQFFQPWNETKRTKSKLINHNSVDNVQPQITKTIATDKLLQQPEGCQQFESIINEGNTLSKSSEEEKYSLSACQSDYSCITDQEEDTSSPIPNVLNVPMFNPLTAKLMNQNFQKTKNVNIVPVGHIETNSMQEPVNLDSKQKEAMKQQESCQVKEASPGQKSVLAREDVSAVEQRKIALYKELCTLDNINSGDGEF